MAFYTAINKNKREPFGDVVWQDGKMTATYWANGSDDGSGRMYLYVDGYQVAELINGYHTLDKRYSGSFAEWAVVIMQKDLAKADKMAIMADEVMDDVKFIRSLWHHQITPKELVKMLDDAYEKTKNSTLLFGGNNE